MSTLNLTKVMRFILINFRKGYVKFAINTIPYSKILKKEKSTWNAGWSTFEVIATGQVSLDHIFINVSGLGMQSVINTPHYDYLNSNYSSTNYHKYLSANYGTDEITQQVESFKKLFLSVKKNPTSTYILVKPAHPFSRRLIVIDGAHRAASMRCLNIKNVKVKITY